MHNKAANQLRNRFVHKETIVFVANMAQKAQKPPIVSGSCAKELFFVQNARTPICTLCISFPRSSVSPNPTLPAFTSTHVSARNRCPSGSLTVRSFTWLRRQPLTDFARHHWRNSHVSMPFRGLGASNTQQCTFLYTPFKIRNSRNGYFIAQ